jgi:hypothetical protein
MLYSKPLIMASNTLRGDYLPNTTEVSQSKTIPSRMAQITVASSAASAKG